MNIYGIFSSGKLLDFEFQEIYGIHHGILGIHTIKNSNWDPKIVFNGVKIYGLFS